MPNITKPAGLSNIWANGGTKIDPGASKVNIGWVVQLPPYEYQNWVDNRQDRAIAHFSQHGIPEWDDGTEYQGLLSYTQGSNGIIYKCIQTNTNKDPSNTLNGQYWAVAFETYGSVAAVQAQLNAHITNYQTLSGVGNPAAARANLSVYSKSESDARFASLNGNPAQVFAVGVATQPEHAVRLGQVASLLTQATESNSGVVRLATIGVTEQGTDDSTALTPLKASTVYLKKSGNLAGLPNVAAARSNLGLGSMATQNVGSFLQAGNNLAEILNVGVARNNLGLSTTATQPETYFLRSGLNLTDLTNVGQARNSLGLTQTATWPLGDLMQKGENLAGLTSLPTARANLGLGSAALSNSGDFLLKGNNLADLTNSQDARNNLGLGNLSVLNVFGLGGANLDFTKSLGGSGDGYFRINDIVVNYGRFSVGARGARVNVTFSLRTSSTLFAGVLPDNAATDQMGTSAVTNVGMSIGTGASDGFNRTGYWFQVGTA
ncbi:putative tail fiber protein [Pseudomonas phage vB_PsyM_KIL3b]|uniref:Putative tail fiber protein n=3 Tax=Pseudomonas phage vB_PsyM_KIL1 TaxID=1777065 RepID=A0A142IFZ0_9CAUD|nr:tail fiber protein [Pseudomonas phage vB_PsyM_KIL1]AMR57326.1 putative tail fiber protein [Pseudomonas phage vB_PsyM_KIL1]AMR57647.1 putative tail fiber protein [Pseudomonas phage vB_PsyM_KIL3]AMR58145.1 putative tail fiber protein [Pseudomonas phage vB_PsyM_KIL3b]